MRERRLFAERSKVLESDSPKKKVFLVYEGAETEEIYFDALIDNRVPLRINPLIELIPLVRGFGEEGWSNPKKIAERVERIVNEHINGDISYESLIFDILDYLIQEKIIIGRSSKEYVLKTLKWICKEKLQKELTQKVESIDSTTGEILGQLSINIDKESIVNNIVGIINSSDIDYEIGLDVICFIFDRDPDSFVINDHKNQYQDVIEICNRNGFNFYVSNPCFEFWLLLHFDDCAELDKSLLLTNPYCNGGHSQRYTEVECKKRIAGFKKNSYNAAEVVLNVDTAIKNEKLFCEDIIGLQSKVGSNVGILIDSIRENRV